MLNYKCKPILNLGYTVAFMTGGYAALKTGHIEIVIVFLIAIFVIKFVLWKCRKNNKKVFKK
jgi:hypothetical protein